MVTKIIVPVEVTSNGTTDNEIKKADRLAASYKLAGAAANSVRTPTAVGAAQRGVANAAGVKDAQDSNTARGIGGLTGAAGRDFAAQAQGLGGLVHVYATFAANLFAISAAFSALSKAADTTNMIKGLDQLGAASGRGLGSLAKQLSNVTDGALSLKDAMTATALASSGGLSGENILRLGKVAKNASQALGIDLPNAVSRLSRGITKLEPELLDELGIMVRVDRASEAYARTLGKTVSGLTDFEKRQGFANAVLEQGEKKFGAIDLSANPYSKVLASTQNLLQSGLELINKVLGPVTELLAKSPSALALTLAGIASLLLKQAIPALGQYRAGLKEAAEASHARLVAVQADQQELARISDTAAATAAEKVFRNEVNTQKRIQDLRTSLQLKAANNAKDKTDYNTLASKDALDISKEELKILDKRATALQRRKLVADQQEGIALKAHLQDMRNIRQEHDDIGFVASQNNELKESTKLSHQTQLIKIFDKANIDSSNRRILSLTAEAAATQGPTKAWEILNRQIAKSKAGEATVRLVNPKTGEEMDRLVPKTDILTNGITRIKGALSIATSAVSTFVNAFQTWFVVLGLAIGAFQLLDNWLSTSSKETEKFNSSLELLNSGAETVIKTLEHISRKDPKDILSAESIQAKATAFSELSDAINTSAQDFYKLTSAWSKWDRFFDWLKDGFGAGAADKLATSLSVGIISSLKLMEEGPAKVAAKQTLSNLVGGNIDISSFSKLEEQLRKLTDSEIADKASAIGKEIKKINLEINNSASSLTAFNNSLSAIDKTIADIGIGLKATDNITKIGSQIAAASFQFSEVLKDPIKSLIALRDLANNTNSLSLLNPTLSSQLLEDKKAISDVIDNLGKYREELTKAKEAQQKFQEKIEAKGGVARLSGPDQVAGGDALLAKAKAADDLVSKFTDLVNKSKIASAELVDKFGKAISVDLFNTGAKILIDSMKGAWEQAGIIVAKSYLSALQVAGGVTAKFDADLQKQEIDVQIKLIESQFNLIRTIQKNTLTNELNIVSRDKATAAQIISGGDVTERAIGREMLDKAIKAEKLILPGLKLLDMPDKTAIKEYKNKAITGTDEEKLAFSKLGNYFESLFGKQSQIAKLFGQQKAIEISGQVSQIQQEATQDKSVITNQITDISTDLEKVKLAEKLSVYYDKALDDKTKELEISKFNKTLLMEEIDAKAKIAIVELALSKFKAGSAQAEEASYILTLAQQNLDTIRSKGAQGLTALQIEQFNKTAAGIEILRQREANYNNQKSKDITDYSLAVLSLQEVQLNNLIKLGALDEATAIREKAKIELSKQDLTYIQEKSTLELKASTDLQAIQDKINLAKENKQNTSKLIEDQTRLLDSLNSQRSTLELINDTKKKNIELDALAAAKLAEQNIQMEKLVGLTESLGNLFSNFGDGLGTVIQQVQKLSNLETNYLEAKLALSKKLEESTDPEKNTEIAIAQAKLDKKYTLDRLSGIAAEAKAAKSMFNEKTFAFKAFASIEKVIHVAKIAMILSELTMDGVLTANSIAGSIARSVVKGKEAIVSALTLPPPFGFIAGAAMTALVAGILGSAFGGGSSIPQLGNTSTDKQSVQGTGSSFVDGKKVENGTGIFGNSEAKSESIKNSLEIIKNNSIEGLDYDNLILKALESIDKAIGSTAKTLYNVVGLRKGSITGTADLSVKTTGITGLFGKTTTKEIIDSGIELNGTFGQLASATSGLIKAYEVLRTTTKNSGFLGIGSSTKVTDTKTYLPVDQQVEKEISSIFKNAQTLFIAVGDKIGLSAQDVISKLNKIDITGAFASLRGLKGDELAKEFSAVIGNLLDNAASSLFSQFDKFKKFGEGLLETVIRVIDGAEKLNVALNSIGKATVVGYDITESLIDAAGGLDKFTKQITFFSDTFLTEAERLVPIAKTVTDTFKKLGYSGVDTREEFKTLVQSLDLSTEAGRNTYQVLQDLAPSFAKVYPEIKSTVSSISDLIAAGKSLQDQYDKLTLSEQEYTAKITVGYTERELIQFNANKLVEKEIALLIERNTLRKRFSDLEVDLLRAQGNELAATTLARQKELDTLNPANRDIQLLINARQDEISAIGRIKSAMASIASALANFKSIAENTSSALTTAASNIAAGFRTALSTADAADKAVIAARNNITQGMSSAQADVTSAMDALNSAKDAVTSAMDAVKDEFRGFAKSIREFILSLSTTSLGAGTDKQQLKSLNALFNSQAIAAKAGDKDALGKITGTADQLLTLAKSQSSTRLEFARISSGVAGVLDSIATITEAKAGTATVAKDPIVQAQEEVAKAQVELAKKVAELAKWQQAAAESGASSVITQVDILAEYKRAREDQAKAQIDLAAWQNAVNESGTTTAETLVDYAKDWRKAKADNDEAQANYQSALMATQGIELSQLTALQTLNNLVSEYLYATTLQAKSIQDQLNISNLNLLTEVRAVVSSIIGLTTTVTTVTTAAVPTMSIPVEPTRAYALDAATPAANSPSYIDDVESLSYGHPPDYWNNKIRGYASGGYHKGGLRMVGEKGPEIEATGPSRIFSAQQANQMMNADLIKEIQALREEVSQLRYSSQQTETNTRKSTNILTRVTRDGESLITVAA